jgi:copper(I)-binding protein
MKLTALEAQRVVGVSSPVAGVAEIHQMKMEGDVMKMSPAGMLELPAGRTVELKPGGLHLMLMDLKRPLAAGSTVPLTLVLRNSAGVESRVDTLLRVSATAPPAGTVPGTQRH